MVNHWVQIAVVLGAFYMALSLNVSQAAERLDVTREFHLVYDLGQVHFDHIVKSTGDVWVLAQIEPSGTSGRLEGVTKHPETGAPAQIPGKRVVRILEGSVRVVAPLAGTPAKNQWNYQLELPAFTVGDLIGIPNDASTLPFKLRNLVICRLNQQSPENRDVVDGSHFSPLYLVPNDWQQYVVPAFEYYKAHPKLFQQVDNIQENRSQLRKLLENENPLLVAAACKALVQGRAIDENLMTGLLARSSGLRQALFAFVLLKDISSDLPPEKQSNVSQPIMPQPEVDLVDDIAKVIDEAKTSAEIEGLALGTWAARGKLQSEDRIHSAVREQRINHLHRLLTLIQRKASVWGIHTGADQRLNSWLRGAGVPEQTLPAAAMVISPNLEKAHAAEKPAPLKLSLATIPGKIYTKEHVPVRVVFENISDEKVRLLRHLKSVPHHFIFFVYAEDGRGLPTVVGGSHHGDRDDPSQYIDLYPNEIFGLQVDVAKANSFIDWTEGKYKIIVSYINPAGGQDCFKGELESEPITVEIPKPAAQE